MILKLLVPTSILIFFYPFSSLSAQEKPAIVTKTETVTRNDKTEIKTKTITVNQGINVDIKTITNVSDNILEKKAELKDIEKSTQVIFEEQDELQADLQDLITEQTQDNIVEVLKDCGLQMNDALDLLEQLKTGGETTGAQTAVIEKIYEATKKKSESSSSGTMKSLFKMMESMMDETATSSSTPQKNSGHNQTPNQQEYNKQVSSSNNISPSDSIGPKAIRKLDKATGASSFSLPREFSDALEAYNKELTSESKDEKSDAFITPPEAPQKTTKVEIKTEVHQEQSRSSQAKTIESTSPQEPSPPNPS